MTDTPNPGPQCDYCKSGYSERYCEDCNQYLCLFCNIKNHEPIGKRNHYRPRLYGQDYINGKLSDNLNDGIQSDFVNPNHKLAYPQLDIQNKITDNNNNNKINNNNYNTDNNTKPTVPTLVLENKYNS